MNFKDLFYFDKMLTPLVLTFIYWLILAAVVIAGVIAMFNSVIGGLMLIVGGLFAARLYCELMMIIFKIYENLKKIADIQEQKASK